ncbi:hypothetical protein GJ496_008146 [Pomphorhynchus laevis]|nr:hypothetical protein GJ496_008146 [Pomphorhynchus laevis]
MSNIDHGIALNSKNILIPPLRINSNLKIVSKNEPGLNLTINSFRKKVSDNIDAKQYKIQIGHQYLRKTRHRAAQDYWQVYERTNVLNSKTSTDRDQSKGDIFSNYFRNDENKIELNKTNHISSGKEIILDKIHRDDIDKKSQVVKDSDFTISERKSESSVTQKQNKVKNIKYSDDNIYKRIPTEKQRIQNTDEIGNLQHDGKHIKHESETFKNGRYEHECNMINYKENEHQSKIRNDFVFINKHKNEFNEQLSQFESSHVKSNRDKIDILKVRSGEIKKEYLNNKNDSLQNSVNDYSNLNDDGSDKAVIKHSVTREPILSSSNQSETVIKTLERSADISHLSENPLQIISSGGVEESKQSGPDFRSNIRNNDIIKKQNLVKFGQLSESLLYVSNSDMINLNSTAKLMKVEKKPPTEELESIIYTTHLLSNNVKRDKVANEWQDQQIVSKSVKEQASKTNTFMNRLKLKSSGRNSMGDISDASQNLKNRRFLLTNDDAQVNGQLVSRDIVEKNLKSENDGLTDRYSNRNLIDIMDHSIVKYDTDFDDNSGKIIKYDKSGTKLRKDHHTTEHMTDYLYKEDLLDDESSQRYRIYKEETNQSRMIEVNSMTKTKFKPQKNKDLNSDESDEAETYLKQLDSLGMGIPPPFSNSVTGNGTSAYSTTKLQICCLIEMYRQLSNDLCNLLDTKFNDLLNSKLQSSNQRRKQYAAIGRWFEDRFT